MDHETSDANALRDQGVTSQQQTATINREEPERHLLADVAGQLEGWVPDLDLSQHTEGSWPSSKNVSQ